MKPKDKSTEKAKEDFIKWFEEHRGVAGYNQYFSEAEFPEAVCNAIIVEWFDSLDWYYVGAIKYLGGFKTVPYSEQIYTTRQEALSAAIKIANERYNELF